MPRTPMPTTLCRPENGFDVVAGHLAHIQERRHLYVDMAGGRIESESPVPHLNSGIEGIAVDEAPLAKAAQHLLTTHIALATTDAAQVKERNIVAAGQVAHGQMGREHRVPQRRNRAGTSVHQSRPCCRWNRDGGPRGH